MQVQKLAALVLCLFASGMANADECAFLPKGTVNPFFPDLGEPEHVDMSECRELTDKTRNSGKPLTLHQLEQARSKLTKPYHSKTVMGLLQKSGLDKRVDCMIALGHFATCHCLSERLPLRVSFVDYLRVVTSAPGVGATQLGISQTEFSKLSGILWSARDQCIAGR